MPLIYAGIDDTIIREGASITIPEYLEPVNGLNNSSNRNIPIQFPPRVTSDSKNRRWEEVHNPASWEEVVTISTASAREITLQLTYVVTGGKWTARYIAEAVRDLRSYFYITVKTDRLPIFVVQMYDVVPPTPRTGGNRQTFRGKNMSVKTSETLIRDTSEGNPVIYPLKTEISLSLALITLVNNPKSNGSNYAFTNPELRGTPPVEWY